MSSADLAAGTVKSEINGAIASVRFFHPKSNSMPGTLLTQLAGELRELSSNSGVKVIVLRSDGDGAFCAGASFDELKAVKDAPSGRAFFSGFAQVMLAMIRAPQFVVARVHGKITGGGVGLVAAADYALATEKAALKLSELALGLGPFVIGPVVERKLGHGQFAALSIDATWRDAHWGERHGLYARVLDGTKEMDEALERLTTFLSKANPEAIKQLKSALWAETSEWEQLLDRRAAISGALVLSAHTRAAIEKFENR
jgi:methylglutaconyl-CoA hydratase